MADGKAAGNCGTSSNRDQQPDIRRQRAQFVASRVRNSSPEQQQGIQNARQQLSFVGGEYERFDIGDRENASAVSLNNARGSTATRPKNLGTMQMESSGVSGNSAAELAPTEEFPDQSMILERLSGIRQHKRQVLDMIDKLKHESGDGEMDKEMLRKLVEAFDNFKEQEEQYLSVLHKILALKTEYTNALEDTAISVPEQQEPMKMSSARPARQQIEEKRFHRVIPHMDDEGGMDSGFSSAGKAPETDELQALIEQRNMLKQMLRQQEELRALQGRQKAQQGQNTSTEQNFDCDAAYEQVYAQQEMLAAKRQELEDLKKQLDNTRSLYDNAPDDGTEAGAARLAAASEFLQQQQHQHQLQDKLRILRDKKQRMDEIINELSVLHESTADDLDRQQRSENMATPISNGQLPAAVNPSGARPKQPVVQGKQVTKVGMPRNVISNNPGGVMPPPEDIRRKLLELEATKSRLAQLQTLVTDLEENGGAVVGPHGLGVSPQLLRLVNELENEDDPQGDEEEAGADLSDLNVRMRSAYQSKLNEQRDAVDKLQEEHARLTAIKNQLLKLNPLSDPLAAERAAEHSSTEMNVSSISGASGGTNSVSRQVEDMWRDFRPRENQQRRVSESRATPDQRLNNTRDNMSMSDYSAIGQQRNVRQMAHLPSVGGSFTAASFASGGDVDDLEMEQSVIRSRRGTESGGSTIVSNPRLASFRRNNQLDEVQKQHRQQQTAVSRRSQLAQDAARCQSTPMAVGDDRQSRRRRRSSTTVEHQYQQLQQHIDSIRLIFQDLMKEHGECGGEEQHQSDLTSQQFRMLQNVGTAPAATTLLTPAWDALSVAPSALAMHQQQLMLSLLACQQQLQLQQIEMRYLQQLCQELWQSNYNNDGNRTRSGSVNSVNQQQQQPAGGPTAAGGSGLPFGAPNFVPFDGRPLSSASLYNLLAPNPYLTMPYYPPPQFGQNFAARGLPRANNGNGGVHSLPRGAGILNNNYVGTPANNSSGASKSNRNAETASVSGRVMSSSVVCQDGQHRGGAVGDRMIVSDSELSIVGEMASSPFKVGAAARLGEFVPSATGGNKAVVPKLNLDDSYKSNVNKSKISNVITQTNGVIPELPSRASSTSGAVTHSGHVSALENGCLTPEQFDVMREVIYSEVATLISQNEQRPGFLLDLFRELQLLTNDYLRGRALEAIRDILNRYLTDDTEAAYNTDQEVDRWAAATNVRPGSMQEPLSRPSAAAVATSDREHSNAISNNHSPNSTRTKREYVETAASESSMAVDQTSNDGGNSSSEKPTSQKRFEHLENIKDVKASLNDSAANSTDVSRSQSRDLATASGMTVNGVGAVGAGKVDVTGLEQQIQTIIDELIPFVRGNADAECSPQLLQYIRKLVLELTTSKCVPPESVSTFFRLQLSSILDDTLAKFRGQKLHECGAEMLADVSEVVFNELAFFRLMQNIDTTSVTRHTQGTDSEASTIPETSESAPLEDVTSETNGDRGESELSSSRQSSLEEELSPVSAHDAVSEISEDLSAVTTISVHRDAEKVETTSGRGAPSVVASDVELPVVEDSPSDAERPTSPSNRRITSIQRKSINTVLTGPVMVQVMAATDEDEITTTTNNSSSSVATSSSSEQSMHTASGGGSVTSDQVEILKTPPTGDSRETTPPDDVEEVPEQLELEPAPPTDTNDVTFDLKFEPHPEDKAQLVLNVRKDARFASAGAAEEDEEEEEEEVSNAGEAQKSSTTVAGRAVAYVSESPSPSPSPKPTDVVAADVTNIAGVVSTVN